MDNESMPVAMQDAKLRFQRVPAWQRWVLIAISTGVAGYFIATESGPFLWCAHVLADDRGRYSMRTAMGATWILCMLPQLAIVAALARRRPPTTEEQSRPPRARVR